jgi:hypothetical protein
LRSLINLFTNEEHDFARTVFLTMLSLFAAACVIDYIRWRRRK